MSTHVKYTRVLKYQNYHFVQPKSFLTDKLTNETLIIYAPLQEGTAKIGPEKLHNNEESFIDTWL